ncbi:MAG: S8 family serine peptidase [Desulfobacteraceae bacterium]|nr:S8 family serine peptidase [Desulfobacteraceae bacterium]MBC2719367.1 S8 family serine peptidase [Desulfobacteraceae bacterium]
MLKKILCSMSLISLVVCAVVALSGLAIAQPGGTEYVLDDVLVKFKAEVNKEAVVSLKLKFGLETVKVLKRTKIHHLKFRSNLTVQEMIERLSRSPLVGYAVPNYIRYLNRTPNDPDYSEQWALNNTGQTGGTPDADIDAPEAWDLQTGSSSMVVAVVDSGIDLTHEDLAANLWTNPGEIPGNGIDDDDNGYIDDVNGWDFRDNDNDPTDTSPICGGHGTHVAGIIGAVGNNGVAVVGVNWDVQIMPLRCFGAFLGIFCTANDSDIMEAIEYYTDFGVRVSNNSYGGGPSSQAMEEVIRASHSVFAAAAGNDGTNNDTSPHYPSNYNLDNIIAVAATDHNDQMAYFSNFGIKSVDLAAPGDKILSTLPGNNYDVYSGTSMASPFVAGAAALLLAQDFTLTNMEVKWRLLKGTDPLGLPVLTGGRLNIYNSLLLEPEVTIDVVPLGPTNIHPGESFSYELTATNLSADPKTVNVTSFVRHPDGSERSIVGPNTITLSGNESITHSFNYTVPTGVPSRYFGINRLVGRVWTSAFEDLDEDEELYNLLP